MWVAAHYGVQPATILSGYRSKTKQLALRVRYALGQREGFAAAPAVASSHTRRTGFDLTDTGDLDNFGIVAPYVGLRWGGRFADPDRVHFDTGR